MAQLKSHGAQGGDSDPAPAFRIFLNYRREDAPFHVDRLCDALKTVFSDDQIFKDVDTIEPGIDFRDAIRDAVEASDVFLSVIGPEWLSIVDAQGRRRLDDAADYVRVEILAALERAKQHRDVRVVPTLVHDAEMPAAEDLPADLEAFAHRHAVELTDDRWADDVERLVERLKQREQRKLARIAAAREATKREQAERAEQEAAERAEREAAERAEREAAGRAEREQAERAAAEREAAKREDAMREAAQRRDREAAQRTDVLHPHEDQDRGTRRVSLPIVIAGVVAAVVVAGAVAVLLSRGGEPPAPGDAFVWRRAAGDLGGRGLQEMTSIAGTERGRVRYVAGGFEVSPQGGDDAAIWTSESGQAWQRVRLQRRGDQRISSITDVGRTWIAVGADDTGGDDDVAMWRWDGVQWTFLPGRRIAGSHETVNRLAETSRGFFGAGWQTRDGDDDDAAVWRFPRVKGGLDATVAPVTDPDLRAEGNQRMHRIVELPGAALLGLGVAGRNAGVWTSDDGTDWTRIRDSALGGTGTQAILDAATFESMVVAVGYESVEGRTRGAVWSSEDGVHWSRVRERTESLATTSRVKLTRIFRAPEPESDSAPALIALGIDGEDAALWTSDDGLRWRREPDESGAFGGRGSQAVSSLRSRIPLVAVGSSGPTGRQDAAVWLGQPAD